MTDQTTDTPEFDPFELASGIEYDADITDSYFGYNQKYKNGEVLCLVLEMTTDNGDERIGLYPVGDKWETTDGGKTITAINPRKKNRIGDRSGLGLLLSYAVKLDGVAPLLLAAAVDKTNPGTEAGIWKGLSFTFSDVKFEGVIDKKPTTWSRTLPTEYLGGDAGDAGTPEAKPSKDQVIAKAVEAIAQSSDTFPVFIERVMVEVDGVEGSDWEQTIRDEGYFNALRGVEA